MLRSKGLLKLPLTKGTASTALTANSLAFLAGWADIMCLNKFQCFGAMMTGNTMNAAMAVAAQRWVDLTFYSAVVSQYLLGILLYRLIDSKAKSQRLIAILLPIFVALGLGDFLTVCFPFLARWQMLPLAFAFGFINEYSMKATGLVTAMVTVHLHKVGSALHAALFARDLEVELRAGLTSLWICVAFAAGCSSSFAFHLKRVMLPGRWPGFSLLAFAYCLLVFWYESLKSSSQ